MADNIAQIDGKDSFAYVGDRAWHGKGQELTEGAPIPVWAREAGLEWEANESDVMYSDAQHVVRKAAGIKLLYRNDTNAFLSTVSSRYKSVQPAQMLGFFESTASDLGFHLNTAGAIRGGTRIFATAKVGDGFRVHGVDRVDPYLLFATSFDGSLATFVRFTSTRVVCENTLRVALSSASTGEVVVRHVSEFNADAVKAQLGLTLNTWKEFEDVANALASVKLNDEKAREFIRNLVNLPQATRAEQEEHPAFKTAVVIYDLFNGKAAGSQLASAKDTVWGMVNAVTEFVDHHKPARSDENRFNNSQFGIGDNMKNKALQQALKLAA